MWVSYIKNRRSFNYLCYLDGVVKCLRCSITDMVGKIMSESRPKEKQFHFVGHGWIDPQEQLIKFNPKLRNGFLMLLSLGVATVAEQFVPHLDGRNSQSVVF